MISALCIADVGTGAIEVVLRVERHIEAPNWHPDGYLIVNGDGRLFRVPLDKPDLVPIDTGFAVNCNNDHGISPCGNLLAISDKSEVGQSCIYVLPIAGGLPRRVTRLCPSYWHGWSPDGRRLAYVGRRDGPFALYTCPQEGGSETAVVTGFDHIDGPDYTPDGRWIWFNGERDGKVELWRVRPDGAELTRMTDDGFVNWFPHPSPDGAQVLYLAYPVGTKGHPGGCDVQLRLIPAEGGTPRTVCRLHGGQGTINVPCWAPDGSRFAFMRYEPE